MKVYAYDGRKRSFNVDRITLDAFEGIQAFLKDEMEIEVYPTVIMRRAVKHYYNQLLKGKLNKKYEIINIMEAARGSKKEIQ